jgi:hypothetical protein
MTTRAMAIGIDDRERDEARDLAASSSTARHMRRQEGDHGQQFQQETRDGSGHRSQ